MFGILVLYPGRTALDLGQIRHPTHGLVSLGPWRQIGDKNDATDRVATLKRFGKIRRFFGSWRQKGVRFSHAPAQNRQT